MRPFRVQAGISPQGGREADDLEILLLPNIVHVPPTRRVPLTRTIPQAVDPFKGQIEFIKDPPFMADFCVPRGGRSPAGKELFVPPLTERAE